MLNYIPKYVRQDSDLAYGEKVTHENYNEKLNLNTTQGDYNTEVLNALFNNEDIESTYHIPYIDNKLAAHEGRLDTAERDIDTLKENYIAFRGDFSDLDNRVDSIVSGSVTTGHAQMADAITGALNAGPSKYYGTDENENAGFIDLPEFIYADEITTSAGVEGIYFIPMLNSVAENMLTEEVREKLNREAIVDYDYLDNRPKINSITLTGNKSLSDLGIQGVGDYATNTGVASTLTNYYTKTQTDSAISTALIDNATQSWVNTQLSNYALSSTVTSVSNVANAAARVQVGSGWSGTPKQGDILITV